MVEVRNADIVEVPAIGSCVRIANGEIDGKITGVTIRAARTQYEVSWWDGRNHKSEWFDEFEVTSIEPRMRVGFLVADAR